MSGREPGTALLLVDLQHDFLDRPGLVPDRDVLCAGAGALLEAVRAAGLCVLHAHTLVRADGSDRMPHWQRRGVWQCVAGTRGALPPPALAPRDGELVVRKRYFSAFADEQLEACLRQYGIHHLIIAGVYLHGCVRSTALDAYERGYEICIVEDAVGTTEPLHAELTRTYLAERGIAFRTVAQVVADLDGGHSSPVRDVENGARKRDARLPIAVIAGRPRQAAAPARFIYRNPCRTEEVLSEIPLGTAAEIEVAAQACEQARDAWVRIGPSARAERLERWADELEAQRDFLVDLIVGEVAKPRRFVTEEVGRAVAHVRIAAGLIRDPSQSLLSVAPGVFAERRPLGTVGLITPWNNPLAIPVGKVAPALAFGNTVILKPALPASRTALAILETLARADIPNGIVNVVLGDATAARALCRERRVAAVSVTGSVATGRAVAAHCADGMKPLQAELGGNNAAIVMGDIDLDEVVPGLVRAAFGFAGQRCTAIRRFIVEHSVASRFAALAAAATTALVNGDPEDPSTEVGPMISAEKRDRVIAAVEGAVAAGATLMCGGTVPHNLAHGAWISPAVLTDVDPHSRIAQEETFGPVAIILPARSLEDALAIANDVPQGLVLGAYTHDSGARARILEAAQAGIVQLDPGPLAVHPMAPFSGWKASGLGPPEHGKWDADFYSRTRAVYRS